MKLWIVQIYKYIVSVKVFIYLFVLFLEILFSFAFYDFLNSNYKAEYILNNSLLPCLFFFLINIFFKLINLILFLLQNQILKF
jgi:hypothetical protein